MKTSVVERDCFLFLDKLRESGVTNMLGAGCYLQREYGLTEDAASRILVKWIKKKRVSHE